MNNFANYCPVKPRDVVHYIRRLKRRRGAIERYKKNDDKPADCKGHNSKDRTLEGRDCFPRLFEP
jgi:hypothetical protein